MSDNQQIFAVKIDRVAAELEVDDSKIRCITGNTVHFDVSKRDFRSFVHTKSNTILLNFYKDNEELFQATVTSKHCLSIVKSLEQI